MTASVSLDDVIGPARLFFVAVPSQAFREVCRGLGEVLRPEQFVVHGTKGLEAGTHRRMSEILQEETCARQIGVLAGPNIAAEIARGKPAGAVVASRFPALAEAVRQALASPRHGVFPALTWPASSSAAPSRTSSPSPPA